MPFKYKNIKEEKTHKVTHNKFMRLDVLLCENGYVDSREKAKYLIKKGCVVVNNNIILKPSKQVKEGSLIVITENFEYVGRGGYKIDGAVKHFGIDFNEKIVADVGCSTGGFTDYALRHGAKKVYAIDIGDVLHDVLRNDKRVIYIPNSDARKIAMLAEKINICLIDITFSPIEDILLPAKNWLTDHGMVLGLIKPPFEIENVKKVNDYEESLSIAKNVADWAARNGYIVNGIFASELKGKTSKQQEFFICLTKGR